MKIAVLHPGEMGVTVASTLQASGHDVFWVAAGRSETTADRAESFNRLADLAQLCASVEAVISVCPPGEALHQARAVNDAGFAGLYVDANAVSPGTAQAVGAIFGPDYVDGGIIGPPALNPGTTRLYLSGARGAEVAGLFSAGPLTANAFSTERTAASVLKMAYAAYTKGSSALLLLVNGLAQAAGVRETLQAEWGISQPGVAERSEKTALGTSRKAWRFVGEMEEIAATFRQFDLPGDFHDGAAELYARMAELKDAPPADLDTVIASLLRVSD